MEISAGRFLLVLLISQSGNILLASKQTAWKFMRVISRKPLLRPDRCRGNLMKAKVIKTELEYTAALTRIEKLMDAKLNTPQGDELDLLSLLIHDYEEKTFPIDKPDPVAAIRFRMEQRGLKPKDLVPLLGRRSRVSEVLSGR